jgi:hypothetical protein
MAIETLNFCLNKAQFHFPILIVIIKCPHNEAIKWMIFPLRFRYSSYTFSFAWKCIWIGICAPVCLVLWQILDYPGCTDC